MESMRGKCWGTGHTLSMLLCRQTQPLRCCKGADVFVPITHLLLTSCSGVTYSSFTVGLSCRQSNTQSQTNRAGCDKSFDRELHIEMLCGCYKGLSSNCQVGCQ